MDYAKFEKVSIKTHSVLNERWVQDRIAEDPSILGLSDVVLRDKERIQPHAGRLDLLFQDTDSSRRYEVEIQFGSTDESHIIRTNEYWDIERKHYPQYEHTAVISNSAGIFSACPRPDLSAVCRPPFHSCGEGVMQSVEGIYATKVFRTANL